MTVKDRPKEYLQY